jgi:hypothetical protein
VPFALVALVVVPAMAGSLRLLELPGGPSVLPANTSGDEGVIGSVVGSLRTLHQRVS